jgi:hypothetical protein
MYEIQGLANGSWSWMHVVASGGRELAQFDSAEEAWDGVDNLVETTGWARSSVRVVDADGSVVEDPDPA